MQHVNEIATVQLDTTRHEGLVLAVDPQHGWVSLLVDDGRRMLLVRPTLVEYTGRRGVPPRDLPLPSTLAQSGREVTAEEVAAAFRQRQMTAEVVDGEVQLLDGEVRIAAPFTTACVRTTNETVHGRVVGLLAAMEFTGP